MKLVISITVIVLALSGVFFVVHNKSSTTNPSQQLTFQTVQSDMSAGAQLIDVRTAAEYASGHIHGATNFSLQDMQAGKLPVASKDKTVYVYCHSGNRSSQATAILKRAGFTVVDLGAINHVQSIGGTITT